MRVWITSFVVLFGMAELYQWVKHFTLPLPVYILGGAFLAIASNYERRMGFSPVQPDTQPVEPKEPTPRGMPSVNPPDFFPLSQSQSNLAQQHSGDTQSTQPISFTIRRVTKQRFED